MVKCTISSKKPCSMHWGMMGLKWWALFFSEHFLNIYYRWQSYQILLMTHHSQIQTLSSITLLNKVCGISYPLKLCRKKRVYFWCGLLEASLLPSNWAYFNLDYLSWFCIFVLKSQLLTQLAIWAWIWVDWIVYVKTKHQILELWLIQRGDEYKIHLKASSLFIK